VPRVNFVYTIWIFRKNHSDFYLVKNSEVKVKISPAHGTLHDRSPLQLSYCNCLIVIVIIDIVSVSMLLLLWFSLLPLSPKFIVITDDCVVADAAFAFVVVTVALFLLSSLPHLLHFYCHP
jgi:hypothetical protein